MLLDLQVQCKLSRKCEIHYFSTRCMALGLRGDLPILSLDGTSANHMMFGECGGELFDSDVTHRQLLMINVITLHAGGRKRFVAPASTAICKKR